MNIKTFIVFLGISIAFIVTAVISYTGLGLPTQDDPLTIRQLSAQNERKIRGGGPSYGK